MSGEWDLVAFCLATLAVGILLGEIMFLALIIWIERQRETERKAERMKARLLS